MLEPGIKILFKVIIQSFIQVQLRMVKSMNGVGSTKQHVEVTLCVFSHREKLKSLTIIQSLKFEKWLLHIMLQGFFFCIDFSQASSITGLIAAKRVVANW